jgi:tRNA-2-methylthio-N6-dimethylallyladenosine synthase
MEKIIEESKQGESLVLENKPENTKKSSLSRVTAAQ